MTHREALALGVGEASTADRCRLATAAREEEKIDRTCKRVSWFLKIFFFAELDLGFLVGVPVALPKILVGAANSTGEAANTAVSSSAVCVDEANGDQFVRIKEKKNQWRPTQPIAISARPAAEARRPWPVARCLRFRLWKA